MDNAKQTIYAQDALLSVKRSAWVLYQHEVSQVNPRTKRRPTPKRALSDVLRWMVFQKKRAAMAHLELTPMQNKILRLMVLEGLTRKEIALRLGKKHATITHHMTQIKLRMGLSSTYQVIAIAVEYGLVGAPQLAG